MKKMHEVNTLKTCTLGLLLGRKLSADECTSGQFFQKRIYSFGQVYIRLANFYIRLANFHIRLDKFF